MDRAAERFLDSAAGAIRGGRRRCLALLDIWQAHQRLVALVRQAKREPEPEVPMRPVFGADLRQPSLF